MNAYISQAEDLLNSIKNKQLSLEERKDLAIRIASLLLQASQSDQTSKEKQMQALLAGLVDDQNSKLFFTELTDQCFRSDNPSRIAEQIRHIIGKRGIPKELPFTAGLELKAFSMLSRAFPSFLVPLAKQAIRKQVSSVVVPGETSELINYLKSRNSEGFRINLNYLGEAILGEEEAENRLKKYIDYLNHPEINYISVKASSIFSQINILAWDDTLDLLAKRIRVLFRLARDTPYTLKDGSQKSKFVNFDMEEYRDLALTVTVFKQVLDEPEFHHFSAGIVLQSYIPDSFLYQKDLTEWALQRKSRGGAPIKVRIVKGANLAMEKIEASMRGWSQAPFHNKWESDANFKRMMVYGCNPHNALAVHLGIASHNLFDLAFGLVLRAENNLEDEIQFEMLEGMAPHMSRSVKSVSNELLLYSPAVEQKDFQTAVAYLMRRLDENTAPENFLRSLFAMKLNSKEWQEQAGNFRYACDEMENISSSPQRTQNRGCDCHTPLDMLGEFQNEPDTDWTLRSNRIWINSFLERWKEIKDIEIPLVIAGKSISQTAKEHGADPSRPGYPIYIYSLATKEHAEIAVSTARNGWDETLPQRSRILFRAAEELRKARGNLIGAMVADTGKTVPEADAEISEAIDFCEYYRRNAEEFAFLTDIAWKPLGAVVVAPPWNFPCSIPVGGIAAALAAGNAVIFKPAPESVLVGWEVANAFWNAGVPKTILQFITGDDDTVGTALVQHQDVAAFVLTGGTQTARHLLKLNPRLNLIAETGGKNSIIVTNMADRDLAIKDVVHSAFGHSGQKCSACSLLILLPDVYHDENFKRHLRDAVSSMTVGSAWNPAAKINPLIRPPEGPLLRGLTELEDGEEWVLQPMPVRGNPHLWSPGIKYGVKTDGYTYNNELFGPMLSVMYAKDLKEAIEIANGTPYGLTAGIQTLDEREWQFWAEHIQAGNLYINRAITGAIVQRQPFGGTKQSSFGPGAKAGGPNYAAQLMQPVQNSLPQHLDPLPESAAAIHQHAEGLDWTREQMELWKASLGSYSFFQNRYFNHDHDPSQVLGQDNILRYIPRTQAILRLQEKDSTFDALRACAAALIAGCPLQISTTSRLLSASAIAGPWHYQCPSLHFIEEDDRRFAERISQQQVNHVRFLSKPSEELARALAEAGCASTISPVAANGRIELLHYHREVAISHDYHRYGNLGDRATEVEGTAASTNGLCCGANRPCCGDGVCDETG